MKLIGPGAFVAVTGASGVGKDALLDEARKQCGEFAVFPQRVITRPHGPGENHLPIGVSEFALAREQGAFAVWWHAHELAYGLPVAIDSEIRAGNVVVVNASRAALNELEARYERVVVVRVTVSDEVRAARLQGRKRETVSEIAKRLGRTDPDPLRIPDYEISNSGTILEGATALVNIIEAAHTTRIETP